MSTKICGNPLGPFLICIPGLMGGPEDFHEMIPTWETHFHLMLVDPNSKRREQGLAKLSADMIAEISYSFIADELFELMRPFSPKKVYFLGLSIGGKIVYDFAIKFPAAFCGAVITDVGPGPFSESDLYKLVDDTVLNTNLSLPWIEMKKDLMQKIPDKNFRILIQRQLMYPEQKPPAIWKVAMKNFRAMLQNQKIDDQMLDLWSINDQLAQRGAFIRILKASHNSGISASSLAELKKMNCLRIYDLEHSSHFIHITHKALIEKMVMSLINRSLV